MTTIAGEYRSRSRVTPATPLALPASSTLEPTERAAAIEVRELSAWYGEKRAVDDGELRRRPARDHRHHRSVREREVRPCCAR